MLLDLRNGQHKLILFILIACFFLMYLAPRHTFTALTNSGGDFLTGRGHKRARYVVSVDAVTPLGLAGSSLHVKTTRRIVVRSEDGWRGSTLYGYVTHGDQITFAHNFRVTRPTLEMMSEKGFII